MLGLIGIGDGGGVSVAPRLLLVLETGLLAATVLPERGSSILVCPAQSAGSDVGGPHHAAQWIARSLQSIVDGAP